MDEVFKRLEAGGVRYLLIGGQAMRLRGMPRFTMDWDVFRKPLIVTNGTGPMGPVGREKIDGLEFCLFPVRVQFV